MGLTIGIAVFENAEELDVVGPWEVLAFWAQHWPDDDVNVFTEAQEDGPVRCAKGMRILPDHTWDSAPKINVLVYPGGQGTRVQVKDDAVQGWVKKIAAAGVSAGIDMALHLVARLHSKDRAKTGKERDPVRPRTTRLASG